MTENPMFTDEELAQEMLMRFSKDLGAIAQEYGIYADVTVREDLLGCYYVLMKTDNWVGAPEFFVGDDLLTGLIQPQHLQDKAFYKHCMRVIRHVAKHLADKEKDGSK